MNVGREGNAGRYEKDKRDRKDGRQKREEDKASRHFKAGISHFDSENYEKARECFKSCFKRRYRALGQDHIDVCLAQEKLGDAMVMLGEVEEAHWQYLLCLRGLKNATSKASSGGTRNEEKIHSRGGSAVQDGAELVVSRVMLSLGDLCYNSGSYERALKYYQKVLRSCVGEEDDDVDEEHSPRRYRRRPRGNEEERPGSTLAEEAVGRAVRAHRALARCSAEKDELEMTLFHYREVLWLSRRASRRGLVSGTASVGTDEWIEGTGATEGGPSLGVREVMRAVAYDNHAGVGGGLLYDEAGAEEMEDVDFSYLQEARRLLEAKGAECTDEAVAKVLGTIASIHRQKDELLNARKCYEEKQEFVRVNFPHHRADLADTAFTLGVVCGAMDQHKAAIEHLSESAKLHKKLKGRGNEKVSVILRHLCTSYLAVRDLSAANQHFKEYLMTGNCSDEVECLTAMGIIHCKRFDLSNAIDCYIEALKVEARYGDSPDADSDLSSMIENLQSIFLAPTKLTHGTYCYEKARDCEDMKIILQNLGLAQLKRRATAASEQFLLDLGVHLNEDGRMDAVDFSSVLFCMGNVLFRRARYQESILYYEQCLRGQFDRVHHADRVDLLANLGTAFLKTGNGDESLEYFKKALGELELSRGHGAGGPFSVDDGSTMLHLVSLLKEAKNQQEQGTADDRDVLMLRHLIGLNLCKELRFDEAVSIFEELIQRRSMAVGENHIDVIELSVDMSTVYLLKGNMRKAAMVFDAAMKKIRRAKVPETHPFMVQLERLQSFHHPDGGSAPQAKQFSLLFM